MEFASFTCQFCAEHQDWDTPRAADAAAVWHLFHARPGRWLVRQRPGKGTAALPASSFPARSPSNS